MNFMISSLLNEKTQDTASAPVIDWKGSLGPSATTSLNNGAYDYRTFTTVNYGRNDWNLALRWRHLPTAIDAAQAVINSNIEAGLAAPGTKSTGSARRARTTCSTCPAVTTWVNGRRSATGWTICSTRRRFVPVVGVPRTRIRARAAARRKPASTTSWAEASTWV